MRLVLKANALWIWLSWYHPSSPCIIPSINYLRCNYMLDNENKAQQKAVWPNSPRHTYTHTHHQTQEVHLSTFKCAYIHSHAKLPNVIYYWQLSPGTPNCLLLRACCTCGLHYPALLNGDCVSSCFCLLTQANAMPHCTISSGKSQGGFPVLKISPSTPTATDEGSCDFGCCHLVHSFREDTGNKREM